MRLVAAALAAWGCAAHRAPAVRSEAPDAAVRVRADAAPPDASVADATVDVPPRFVPLVGAIDFVRNAMGEVPWCVRTEGMGVVRLDGEVVDGRRYASRPIERAPRGASPFVTNDEDAVDDFSVYAVDADGTLRHSDAHPWGEPDHLDAPLPDVAPPGARALVVLHASGYSGSEYDRTVMSLDALGRLWEGSTSEGHGSSRRGALSAAVDLQAFEHTHDGNEFVGFHSWLAPVCALTRGGAVWCFAFHSFASAPPTAADATPRPVANLRDVAGFDLARSRGCAWTRAGALWCFPTRAPRSTEAYGERVSRGQPMRFVAARVPWPPGVVEAAVSSGMLCARHADGAVRCDFGGVPREIPGARGARAIDVAFDQGCAIMPDATVRCWGSARGPTGALVYRGFERVAGLSDVARLSVGAGHACALDRAGALRCWGANGGGQVDPSVATSVTAPRAVEGIGRVRAVAAGEGFTCAAGEDGRVRCWGGNRAGRLGVASPQARGPVVVPGVVGATGVAVGSASACAWDGVGTLRCWGALSPVRGRVSAMAGMGRVREAVEVDGCWCARDDVGAVRCRTASEPRPRRLDLGAAAARLFPGRAEWHATLHESPSIAVLRTDGRLSRCSLPVGEGGASWNCEDMGDARDLRGAGTSGQRVWTWRADGTRGEGAFDRDREEPVPLLRDAVDVQDGPTTCGLLRDGTVACGGDGDHGELADGEAPPEEALPALVALPPG